MRRTLEQRRSQHLEKLPFHGRAMKSFQKPSLLATNRAIFDTFIAETSARTLQAAVLSLIFAVAQH